MIVIFILFFLFLPHHSYAIDCQNTILKITTPVNFQTYQRISGKANIIISGSINNQGGSFSTNYNNVDTQLFPTFDGDNFKTVLPNQSQGQDTLTITWTKDTCIKKATINYVGIGDIFLVAGQSNHGDTAINPHQYSHPRLKATVFNRQKIWKDLNNTKSYFPYLATKIMKLTNVPVAFISSAFAGKKIDTWSRNNTNPTDTTTHYGFALDRIRKQNSIRAILWWQGESDVIEKTPAAQYKESLIKLANNFSADLGPNIPLIAYQFGPIYDYDPSRRMVIIDAIRQASVELPNKIILGPDLGDANLNKPPPENDTLHFKTDEVQQMVAKRVFTVLSNTIYLNEINNQGDANNDKKIDLLDFAIWKKEYLGTMSTKKSNFNHDNIVDILDFGIWKTGYLSK